MCAKHDFLDASMRRLGRWWFGPWWFQLKLVDSTMHVSSTHEPICHWHASMSLSKVDCEHANNLGEPVWISWTCTHTMKFKSSICWAIVELKSMDLKWNDDVSAIARPNHLFLEPQPLQTCKVIASGNTCWIAKLISSTITRIAKVLSMMCYNIDVLQFSPNQVCDSQNLLPFNLVNNTDPQKITTEWQVQCNAHVWLFMNWLKICSCLNFRVVSHVLPSLEEDLNRFSCRSAVHTNRCVHLVWLFSCSKWFAIELREDQNSHSHVEALWKVAQVHCKRWFAHESLICRAHCGLETDRRWHERVRPAHGENAEVRKPALDFEAILWLFFQFDICHQQCWIAVLVCNADQKGFPDKHIMLGRKKKWFPNGSCWLLALERIGKDWHNVVEVCFTHLQHCCTTLIFEFLLTSTAAGALQLPAYELFATLQLLRTAVRC